MKAIPRYLALLLLICGTALAWKNGDRRFRAFAPVDEGARQKEEGAAMQAALSTLQARNPVEISWSRSEFQAKLEESFHKNDPCAVLELLRSTGDAAPRDFWSAGMLVLLAQTREKTPLLNDLLGAAESPLFGQSKEDPRKEVRFFNALLYSGQLHGIDENEDQPRRGTRNLERSIEILKELTAEDPDNGAFPFFLATALRQSGAKKEEVHAAMSQAARAAKFDVFYQAIFDQLQALAYGNVATFAWAYSFLEGMPYPDYEAGIRYLKYWASTEDTGKWIAQKVAKRLIDLGAKYKAQSPGYQFSRSEYMLGHNLKYTVEGRQEKSWKDYIERMQEAQAFIAETPRPVVDAEISLFSERIAEKSSCGPDAWKSLYAAYKAKKAPN